MTLARNLEIAESAISDISRREIISSNKIGHRIRASGGIENVIGKNQGTRTGILGVAGTNLQTLRGMTQTSIRDMANRSVQSKSGNCGELAMVAAIYMIDEGGTPVHLMWFTTPGYDHMWATIGVHAAWKANNLRSWGSEAVWVDPWQTDDGIAFSINDFVKGKVRNLNAIYKCNTVELVEAGGISGKRVG